MCSLYDIHVDIVYVIRIHLGAGAHDIVQWGNVPK